MNAPLSANLERIVIFDEFLTEGFVEETIARQKRTQENKIDALLSLDRFEKSCNHFSKQMQEMGSALDQQSRNANKL